MERYRKGLEDIENMKAISGHVLDPQKRKDINMMYGSPTTLPIPLHSERPPSPVDAIEKSCEFLTREYQKGFMPKFDAENYKKTLLRPALLAKAHHKMMQKNTQKFDIDKLYETEKYQEFWLSSDTVSKVKREISKLPFISSSDIQVVIGRFLELVASIVRAMKHKNMLENEDKQSKKQLRNTMVYFISETNIARQKAFRYAFQQEFLDLDKLNDSYKDEFKDDIPKYSRQQKRKEQKSKNIKNEEGNLDQKMIDHYSLTCDKLPPAYKMTNYQMNEDQRLKTRKELKKFVSELPHKILNGIVETELLKAKSEQDSAINDELQEEEEESNQDLDEFSNIDSEGFPINSRNHSSRIHNESNLDFDILNSCKVKIPRRSPKIITIPITKKTDDKDTNKNDSTVNSENPSVADQSVHFDYWSYFDPLAKNRGGADEFKSISQIHKISSTFRGEYDHINAFDSSLPFKLECEEIAARERQRALEEEERLRREKEMERRKRKSKGKKRKTKANGPTLIGDIWSTSDLPNQSDYQYAASVGKEEKEDEEDEEEEEEAAEDESEASRIEKLKRKTGRLLDGYQKITLETERRSAEAMRFLNSYRMSSDSKKSSMIVNKLQEIWENLGFTVQQKLSLLVKYTSSAEESQKLNDALNFWEMTSGVVARYNEAYQTLKDFVRFEAESSNHPRTTCEMLKHQIEACEENVKMVADNLLQTFGDELIIKRRTAQQIIPERHKKMMEMISPFYNY